MSVPIWTTNSRQTHDVEPALTSKSARFIALTKIYDDADSAKLIEEVDVKLTVAEFVSSAVRKCGKTQKQITREAGFGSANMISLIKSRDARVPLARVPALADALEVSRQELLRLCLAEYEPEFLGVLEAVLPGYVLSEDEAKVIAALRSIRPSKT